jgi:hypothetical protein
MRAGTGDYLFHSLVLMQITWEQFARLFRTVGQVFGIYQEKQLVGFYWIEDATL